MIEITEEFVYEREACDCCEGWYNQQYQVTIHGQLIGTYSDLEDVLSAIEENTMELTFIRTPYPED